MTNEDNYDQGELTLLKKGDFELDDNTSSLNSSGYKFCRTRFQQELKQKPVLDLLIEWLDEIEERSPNTAKSYGFSMRRLAQIGIMPLYLPSGAKTTLEDFREILHEQVVDTIKRHLTWSEATKQARAACYISFTKWLGRLTEGWIREAKPQVSGVGRTFYKTRDKVSTQALSIQDCYRLLDAISKINTRDGLIAKAAFGGGSRISEILNAKLSSIDFSKNSITYQISKNRGTLKEVSISYRAEFMLELQDYIKSTDQKRQNSSHIFMTREGKPVVRQRMNDTFKQAAKNLGWLKHCEETKKWIGRKPSPHTLRASWITYARAQGFSADDIGEVTGQATTTVRSYDKRSIEDNLTKQLRLI